MAKTYDKPPLTFDQQVALLESRGMGIADRHDALLFLEHVSYYRFSAYAYPFRKPGGGYSPGTNFEQVVALYEGDRRLRLVILDGLERAEVSLRTRLTHHIGHKYGGFGHCDAAAFSPHFDHAGWLARTNEEVERSRETFIAHFRANYDGFPRIPLWMATEAMSFGALSKFYSGLKREDQTAIAAIYGIHPPVLRAWLHTLAYVRNLCAHHARLWNRELAIRPDFPAKDNRWQGIVADRLWSVALILRWMQAKAGNGEDWKADMEARLLALATTPGNRLSMGMQEDWRTHPLWAGA